MPKVLRGALHGGTLLLVGALCAARAIKDVPAGAGGEEKTSRLTLRQQRQSPLDLEIAGEPDEDRRTTQYVSRESLLRLPQVAATVTDDANFRKPTEISGVLLEELRTALPVAARAELIVAICSDRYHAHFPADYLAKHHPILVLKVNGKGPEEWPKDVDGHSAYLGPYLISHAKFTPSFTILRHEDEAQIPWGVVRLEFRRTENVLGAITPDGPAASDANVQAGFRIAQQNCFRCHNAGVEGGTKAGISWPVLAGWAAAAPEKFAAYVRNPQASNPKTQMAASPQYDELTMKALIDYFKTFANRREP
jgi:mono/diheme cytochrome c family protein